LVASCEHINRCAMGGVAFFQPMVIKQQAVAKVGKTD